MYRFVNSQVSDVLRSMMEMRSTSCCWILLWLNFERLPCEIIMRNLSEENMHEIFWRANRAILYWSTDIVFLASHYSSDEHVMCYGYNIWRLTLSVAYRSHTSYLFSHWVLLSPVSISTSIYHIADLQSPSTPIHVHTHPPLHLDIVVPSIIAPDCTHLLVSMLPM